MITYPIYITSQCASHENALHRLELIIEELETICMDVIKNHYLCFTEVSPNVKGVSITLIFYGKCKYSVRGI